jgi:hypothetical protein
MAVKDRAGRFGDPCASSHAPLTDNPRVLLASVLPDTITPYLLLMLAGFVVGSAGHLYKSKVTVAIGIMMIFAATLLLPLALVATEESPDTPPSINPPGSR